MLDWTFEELKEIYQKLQITEQTKEEIFRAAENILYATVLFRKEGILSLGEFARDDETHSEKMKDPEESILDGQPIRKLDLDNRDRYFADLLWWVTNGTDPEIIEEIGRHFYISSKFSVEERLVYLMYLDGTLKIQSGINPHIVEEKVILFLPLELREEFRKKLEQKN